MTDDELRAYASGCKSLTLSGHWGGPRIVRIVQTCTSCPSQWEGFLADGRAFYARFRFGHLRVTAHLVFPLADDADVLVDEYDEGDAWAGFMDYAQLRDILIRAGIDSPESMESENTWHKHIVPALA